MVKFTVSTDSTCDLYRQYVDENDVKFVSLTFTVEEKGTLTDGLDAFTSYQQYVDFYAKLRAGGFSIEDAVTLERAAELAEAGRIAEAARGADVLFAELPALYLSARGETVIKHGAPWRTPLPDGGCRLYGPDGTFLGLGGVEIGQARIKKSFY